MTSRVLLLAAALLLPASAPAQTPTESATVSTHVSKAEALAGDEFRESLFLCRQGKDRLAQILKDWKNRLPPTQAFDNLYYIGNGFVGVWVLQTSDGLVMFDAGTSTGDVTERIFPEMRALGLDPADLGYALVTHAHWDHYGGARYLQENHSVRIGLTEPDWRMLETSVPGSMERAPPFENDRADRPPPRRDLVIEDGQQLKVGDTTITLFVTPGHTPGTLSALIPVKEGDRTYTLSLLGGTAFPRTLQPTDRMGGLIQNLESVERLAKLSREAGAVGLLNTHISVDGTARRLADARHRAPGEANPFVLGVDAISRYYGMFGECLKAAASRLRAQ